MVFQPLGSVESVDWRDSNSVLGGSVFGGVGLAVEWECERDLLLSPISPAVSRPSEPRRRAPLYQLYGTVAMPFATPAIEPASALMPPVKGSPGPS